jgi:hypothetical protein
VHGEIIETVYAFDQPVIPAGSAITGHIKKFEPVKKWRRIQAYANGNFTPARDYHIKTAISPAPRTVESAAAQFAVVRYTFGSIISGALEQPLLRLSRV